MNLTTHLPLDVKNERSDTFMVWTGTTVTLPLSNFQGTEDFNHPGPMRVMANFYMQVTALAMTKRTAQATEPCICSHTSATNIQ